MDASQTDDKALIGEECHIVARKEGGPRGEHDLPKNKRDKYRNLILLCRNHHREIDQNVGDYPVEKLNQIKSKHEAWVRNSLGGFEADKQRDEEIYAEWLERWEDSAGIDTWDTWSSWIFGGHPEIHVERYEALQQLADWLFNRPWPKRYSTLEASFENFRAVLNDLLVMFERFGEDTGPRGSELRRLKKFQLDPSVRGQAERRRAEQRTRYVAALVEDLTLELTRAANLICEMVRKCILPAYRLDEGVLTIKRGRYIDLSVRKFRPEYDADVEPANAYPGLDKFQKTRSGRDICIQDEYKPEHLGALGKFRNGTL